MIRHFLTVNINDPFSDSSRGEDSTYIQYFSGDGTENQINYLEKKPTSSGYFRVWIDDVEKTVGTDNTLDRDNLTLTWDEETDPAEGNDNIKVKYQIIQGWIYDDNPAFTSSKFPRITVEDITQDYEAASLGSYNNYTSGIGDKVTCLFKIIVRYKRNNQFLTLDNINYKNMDLVSAICEEIKDYININKKETPWKFYDWEIERFDRIRSEEDFGILRKEATFNVIYWDKS